MTEQELTKKIIKRAEKQAAGLIKVAEDQRTAKIEAAQDAAKTKQAAAITRAQNKLAEREIQQKRAHEVEMVKARINAKQAVIQQAFDQVRNQLINADAPTIKKLVSTLTEKYARPGDTITIAQHWSHAAPQLPATTTIDGGIIIENNTYRLELSVDALLDELHERIAPEVAQILGVH